MADFTTVIRNLEARGFLVHAFDTAAQATAFLAQDIQHKTVGFGGSVSFLEMGLYEALSQENAVYWHWKTGFETREKAKDADVYLCTINGLAETGEIINIDRFGNRVASTLYGHQRVYLVAGENKLSPTVDQAMWRVRNVVSPKNAQRQHCNTPCAQKADRCYDCNSADRICRGLVVLWNPIAELETHVILVHETLGY